MMREILFKAKRIDNGEWVEGALLDGEKHCLIGQEIKFSPYTENECKIVGYQVDRTTICQYTGLTDKNGNKIWENDIVKQTFYKLIFLDYGYGDEAEEISGDETGVVTITASKGACLKRPYQNVWINEEQEASWKRISTNKNICSYRSEVIGNIFDNPELLKGGKEE